MFDKPIPFTNPCFKETGFYNQPAMGRYFPYQPALKVVPGGLLSRRGPLSVMG
jgi:hypothetical protein